ncbi:MAG: flagellar hook capping protein [Desulfosporosinus sp. BRH_c37]|nr:MAG: flagellar hook capping protein [Desulfosporosinus sp. BRH_c37]
MSNTIDRTGSANNTTGAGSGSQSTVTNDALGKDDFLQLLVAQMQNQDPLNPTDSKDSIAQLAQFSSLEQMNNISASMNSLSQSMTYFSQQSSLTQGAAMIGKWVSGVDTDGETAIEGTVEAVKWLEGDPKLQIRKEDGTLVDLEMSMITLVKSQQPVSVATVTP